MNTLTKDIKHIKDQLIDGLKKATIKLMQQKGVESNSDLIKSVEWEYRPNQDMFTLMANDYWYYVSTGRRRGSQPPVKDILQWVKEKNITIAGLTTNQVAYVIGRSIKINGIKGKKYDDIVTDATSDMIANAVATGLSEVIVNGIVASITNK
jgi:hypothetical protein